MIVQHGPSVVFLPSPRLSRDNLEKTTSAIGQLARDLNLSQQELRNQARRAVLDELAIRDELDRFASIVA
jgi:hypothetical protein